MSAYYYQSTAVIGGGSRMGWEVYTLCTYVRNLSPIGATPLEIRRSLQATDCIV